MGRRFVHFAIAAAILGGLGYAAFAYFTRTPDVEQVDTPVAPEIKGELPTADEFEHLAKTDPVAMFEACLARFKRDKVQTVTAVLEKQERVRGSMNDCEVIQLTCAGDVPDAEGKTNIRVRMIWESGFRKVLGVRNLATLYVAGENDDKMLTLTSLGATMPIDPKGSMPRGASRYCITDGGLYRGMLRTYDAWKRRQAAGELNATFLGVQTPKEVGRPCFVIQRRCSNPEVDPFALDETPDPKADPKRDGAAEVTAFIDIERWLHIGTILKRADGSLLAEYWFRDVKLHPSPLEPNPFTLDATKAAVKK